jgi:ABC-type sulfate/molybdate transport systems ATPase subunit
VQPDVLLLDESFSALDRNLREEMQLELSLLLRQLSVTTILVTHDQREAFALGDRIAVMNAGRIEQAGSPEDVYLRPSTRFVAEFLGAVNWIDGAGVRPESLRLARAAPADGQRYRAARVVRSVFLGNYLQVQMTLADGARVMAETARGEQALGAGESVYVCWRAADEMRFS